MGNKVIVITGASGGIGLLTVQGMQQQGYKVYACARNVDAVARLQGSNITPLYMDLTDEKSIEAAVEEVVRREERIDVLVNNAGYGLMGPFETVSMDDARHEMDVNLFGMVRLTQLVLPVMRRQGSGRIINVSSVAGRAPFHLFGWYNISKYAVEAFTDCLRMETKDFGIKVSLVEPAPISTPWGTSAAASLAAHTKGTPYEAMGRERARNLRRAYQSRLFSSPATVDEAFRHAIESRHSLTRYRCDRGAGLIIFLHGLLPTRWWDGIVRGILMVRV